MTSSISTPEFESALFAVLWHKREKRRSALDAGERGAADALALSDERSARAEARRSRQYLEPDGVPNAAKRAQTEIELDRLGDAEVREIVREMERSSSQRARKLAEEKILSDFTWTDDPELGASENKRRRDEALQKFLSDPHRCYLAAKHVQETRPGGFSPLPGVAALEAEARAEAERRYPYLYAHLRPASQGGAQARSEPRRHANELAREVLAVAPGTYSRRALDALRNPAALRRTDKSNGQLVEEVATLSNDLIKLKAQLVTTYRSAGREIAGLAADSEEKRAETLARAVLSFDPGEPRERFLGAIMRASGVGS